MIQRGVWGPSGKRAARDGGEGPERGCPMIYRTAPQCVVVCAERRAPRPPNDTHPGLGWPDLGRSRLLQPMHTRKTEWCFGPRQCVCTRPWIGDRIGRLTDVHGGTLMPGPDHPGGTILTPVRGVARHRVQTRHFRHQDWPSGRSRSDGEEGHRMRVTRRGVVGGVNSGSNGRVSDLRGRHP